MNTQQQTDAVAKSRDKGGRLAVIYRRVAQGTFTPRHGEHRARGHHAPSRGRRN